jgi:hypothetical protein
MVSAFARIVFSIAGSISGAAAYAAAACSSRRRSSA